jgi:hypothetical protein
MPPPPRQSFPKPTSALCSSRRVPVAGAKQAAVSNQLLQNIASPLRLLGRHGRRRRSEVARRITKENRENLPVARLERIYELERRNAVQESVRSSQRSSCCRELRMLDQEQFITREICVPSRQTPARIHRIRNAGK